jgi:hypothetical protein
MASQRSISPNRSISPLATTPSRRQQHAQKKTVGPAGNRKSKRAEDVLPFFELGENNKKTCIFCV